MDTIELIKDVCLFGGSIPNERIQEVRTFLENMEKQLNKHDVSGSIYGYALEIRSTNYNGSWFRHYNHKIYKTEDSAKDAINQMKYFKFYECFEWRIVALYCH